VAAARPQPSSEEANSRRAMADLLREIRDGGEICRRRAQLLRRERESMSPRERVAAREAMQAEAAMLMARLARLEVAAGVAAALLLDDNERAAGT
jgi:hypothetical protein